MSDQVEKKEESSSSKASLSDVFDERTITNENEGHRTSRRKKNLVDLKCPLCENGTKFLSYKEVYQVKKYTSVRGKIIGRDKSGMCAKHQRQLTNAIKRARYMALMPYVLKD